MPSALVPPDTPPTCHVTPDTLAVNCAVPFTSTVAEAGETPIGGCTCGCCAFEVVVMAGAEPPPQEQQARTTATSNRGRTFTGTAKQATYPEMLLGAQPLSKPTTEAMFVGGGVAWYEPPAWSYC